MKLNVEPFYALDDHVQTICGVVPRLRRGTVRFLVAFCTPLSWLQSKRVLMMALES